MPPIVQFHVHLLGGFRVLVGEREVRSFPPRQTSLLSHLALAPGYRLHREWLMDALWPDLDLDAQTNNLNVTLHAIRKRLISVGVPPGTLVIREGQMVVLGPAEDISVDVVGFDAAAARAWQEDDPAITQSACDLYVGDLVPELPFDDHLEARRTTLRASVLALFARLGSQYAHTGQIDAAIAAFTRLVSLEPNHEDAHGALMRLYVMSGQRQAALDQYNALVRQLANDLDMEPQEPIQRLADAIRAGEFPETTRSLVADRLAIVVPTEPAIVNTVPTPLTDLIGRERDIAEVCQLLATRRLVTLTGPGGVGKTRLAIDVGHAVADAFTKRVNFVNLSALRDPALVVPTIAAILGVRETREMPLVDTIVMTMQPHRMLLILDNLEQVIEAANEISHLIAACPLLTVLVTSRSPLRIRGEADFAVAPLPLPTQEHAVAFDLLRANPTVALFIDRARAGTPDFDISAKNAEMIVAICQRLEGIPLAIELAAAWIRLLSLQALLLRLRDPLNVLTDGARDLPERQRTMRATVQWSYDLLLPNQQRVFRQLAVFAGGWTTDSAKAVVIDEGENADVLTRLASLLDANLITRHEQANGEPRFGMLETIREFGVTQLSVAVEMEPVSDRHARYFIDRAMAVMTEIGHGNATLRISTLEADIDNLRAALAWTLTHAPERALAVIVGLERFWRMRHDFDEWRRWLEQALENPPEQPTVDHAMAHCMIAFILAVRPLQRMDDTNPNDAIEHAETAARLFTWLEDDHGVARAKNILGIIAFVNGDTGAGVRSMEDALSRYQAIGDRRGIAVQLNNLGQAYADIDDLDRSDAYYQESLACYRAMGDVWEACRVLRSLGLNALSRRDADTAIPLLEEVLHICREHDFPYLMKALESLGYALMLRPDFARAAAVMKEGLEIAHHLHDPAVITLTTMGLAGIAAHTEQPLEAARLFGAADALQASIRLPLHQEIVTRNEQAIERSRSQASVEAWEGAWAEGRAMLLGDAIDHALALCVP